MKKLICLMSMMCASPVFCSQPGQDILESAIVELLKFSRDVKRRNNRIQKDEIENDFLLKKQPTTVDCRLYTMQQNQKNVRPKSDKRHKVNQAVAYRRKSR